MSVRKAIENRNNRVCTENQAYNQDHFIFHPRKKTEQHLAKVSDNTRLYRVELLTGKKKTGLYYSTGNPQRTKCGMVLCWLLFDLII